MSDLMKQYIDKYQQWGIENKELKAKIIAEIIAKIEPHVKSFSDKYDYDYLQSNEINGVDYIKELPVLKECFNIYHNDILDEALENITETFCGYFKDVSGNYPSYVIDSYDEAFINNGNDKGLTFQGTFYNITCLEHGQILFESLCNEGGECPGLYIVDYNGRIEPYKGLNLPVCLKACNSDNDKEVENNLNSIIEIFDTIEAIENGNYTYTIGDISGLQIFENYDFQAIENYVDDIDSIDLDFSNISKSTLKITVTSGDIVDEYVHKFENYEVRLLADKLCEV